MFTFPNRNTYDTSLAEFWRKTILPSNPVEEDQICVTSDVEEQPNGSLRTSG